MHIYLPALACALSTGCILLCGGAAYAGGTGASKIRSVQVTGTGTDLLNGAIVHSKRQTPTGMIQQSTETVELKGGPKRARPISRDFDVRFCERLPGQHGRSGLFGNRRWV